MKLATKLFFLVILISFYTCKTDSTKGGENTTEDYDDQVNTTDTTCLAPSTWFTIVDGTRKTPPPNEGPTSVFANNKTVTNCDFQKWSWQKFLWLTNEVNGQPLFMDSLIQVNSIGQRLDSSKGIVLTDTAQASGKHDVLRTPQFSTGTPPASTVYYGIFVDDSLYNTMVEYGPIAKNNPSGIKDITFPVGALEVKSAWVDVNALEDPSSYFVTGGTINGVATNVALLGIHVVGIVENHPEFVWATFEHEGLAPSYDWSKATPTTDAPVTSTTDYPFFNKAATATVKNITTNNGIFTDIFSVYKFGIPVQKEIEGSDDVQVYMETSQKGDQNFNNISTINESVKEQLTGIWNNYFYNGSLWINTEGYEGTTAQANLLDSLSYNLSNSSPGDLTRGSVAAYNIMMETYVQVGFAPTSIHGNTVTNLVNCFSCHNTTVGSNSSPLNISHVFTGYVQNLSGFSKEEIKENHVNEQIRQFLLRQTESK